MSRGVAVKAKRATSNRLGPVAADRLVKLCGMFGSHHDGERAAASKRAHALVLSNGLTWRELIAPTSPPDLVRWILKHAEVLNEWEASFVSTLRGDLSPKQKAKLDQIVEKVHAHIRSKGI